MSCRRTRRRSGARARAREHHAGAHRERTAELDSRGEAAQQRGGEEQVEWDEQLVEQRVQRGGGVPPALHEQHARAGAEQREQEDRGVAPRRARDAQAAHGCEALLRLAAPGLAAEQRLAARGGTRLEQAEQQQQRGGDCRVGEQDE